MPRIWADTIDGHRRQVNDAILDAAASLIAEHGPLSVTMSAIAERAGIGRATLYKYFADVESILVAWHTRDFAEHRRRLAALSDADDVSLVVVAELVCGLRRQHLHGGAVDVVGPLAHTLADARHSHGDAIDGEILGIFAGVLRRLVDRGEVRDDLDPDLLARWLLHAAHAPLDLDDTAAARLLADSLAPR